MQKNHKTIFTILVALSFVLAGCINQGDSNDATVTPTPVSETVETTITEVAEEVDEANVKEFTVSGDNFEFDLKEMRVNQGDTVRVKFVNKECFHDWVVDEFNARTEVIQKDQEETIEFVADKTGTFEYYCSVGEHRAMGMVGNLIVE